MYFEIIMQSRGTKSALPGKARTEVAWFTAGQLAARWQVHPMTIRRYFYAGRLKGRTFSPGVIRFQLKDVLAFEQEA